MAQVHWLGTADAVAQVNTVTVGGTLSGETFTISIGRTGSDTSKEVQICSVVASDHGNDKDTVRTALVNAWQASTHPYATVVTAAATANTGEMTFTADTAGVPFGNEDDSWKLTLNTPGGSATFTQAATTASAGPHDVATAANWSGGAVPSGTDTIWWGDCDVNTCWNLRALSAVTPVLQFTNANSAHIGLDKSRFATSADGGNYSTTDKPEYRETYLYTAYTRAEIGTPYEGVSGTGSQRIKIDNSAGAGTHDVVVHNTATTAIDAPLPAVLINSTSVCDGTYLYVSKAPGGVGYAVEDPSETTGTNLFVEIADAPSSTRVVIGPQVRCRDWTQNGGNNILRSAADMTGDTVICNAGTLTMEGEFLLPTLTVNGGNVIDKHINSDGVEITTVNHNGGTVDTRQSAEARTYTTYNHEGGMLKGNANLTITTYNEPTGKPYTLTATT